jgi:hypothetical protein
MLYPYSSLTVPHSVVRWDPQREDQTFFFQSAALRLAYYFIQITIHRPFIPSFRKESSLSFSALAICASAARACSHVADAVGKRYPALSSPNILVRNSLFVHVVCLFAYAQGRAARTAPHICFRCHFAFKLVGCEADGYIA